MGTPEISLAAADPFLRAEIAYRRETMRRDLAQHRSRRPVRRRHRRLHVRPGRWLTLPRPASRPTAVA